MNFETIDFHTHPFMTSGSNICSHTDHCDMSAEHTKRDFLSMGISRICGSVIQIRDRNLPMTWEVIRACNDEALELQKLYGDFYIPGFQVHPDFVRESCEEIERMHALDLRLIGELVPYHHGWSDYSCKGFSEILDLAEQYGMVVSFHPMDKPQMDQMVKNHPHLTLVAAHPGEYGDFMSHMERMKLSENYYLDLSGTGLFRHGMLRHAIDLFGPERFLFGSDYPTCSPAMFLGGVRDDFLLTDREKELILAGNAKRLLGLS